MDHWEQYMYRSHSLAELSEFALRLKCFRFCRAIGGHANDGDQLVAVLRFSDAEDLSLLWHELGASLPLDGYVTIAGAPVFVHRYGQWVTLSLSGADGDYYEVTERDIEHAERIERSVPSLASRAREPPVDSKHCVCPKYYPHIWADAGGA
jgi:hypothetical protein